MNNLQEFANNIKYVAALQDGSDTVCFGVDTLNTETLKVTTIFTLYTVLAYVGQPFTKRTLFIS